jgi:hypothetical protein
LSRDETIAAILIVVIVVAAVAEVDYIASIGPGLKQPPSSIVRVVVLMPATAVPFRSIAVDLINVTLVYRHTFFPSSSNRSLNIQVDSFEDFATSSGFNITLGGNPVPAGVVTKIRLVIDPVGTLTDNAGTVFALRSPSAGSIDMPIPFSLYQDGVSTLVMTLRPNATQISATDYRFGFSYSLSWVELSGGVTFTQSAAGTA